MTLHPLDITVIAIYAAAYRWRGIFVVRKKPTSVEGYFLAGRTLS